MRVNNWIKAAVAVLVLTQCSEPPAYEQYYAVSKKGWHKDSAAIFEVNITDTTAWYTIYINLRCNDEYPYANLFLFREIISNKGLEYRDTAEYVMADAYGRWLGEGSGELQQFNWPYGKRALQFAKAGTYRFKFVQAMRTTSLQGVEDVGLTMYKKEANKDGKAEN